MRLPVLAFVVSAAACYGPPGDPGDDGKEGPRGPAGPPGAAAVDAYRPVYRVGCSTVLDIISAGPTGSVRAQDGIPETEIAYELVAFTNGDAQAQCQAGIGAAQRDTDSTYYPAITKGAQNGVCVAAVDYGSNPGGEVGFWLFDVQTAGPRAVYKDSDNPLGLNGFSYQFPEADCSAHMLGAGGKWSLVMLADVF